MTKMMPMVEARKILTTLPEQFQKDPWKEAVAVTRRGEPVLAVMPWDLYESIVETLEIMADQKQFAALRQDLRGMRKGKKGIPWEKVKQEIEA